ncbi:MAG TPA: DNA-processing protein DprA [Methylomirabilota bacterium]|nr:DNA-processing protein DprA [Methylomirabilota bacterium]
MPDSGHQPRLRLALALAGGGRATRRLLSGRGEAREAAWATAPAALKTEVARLLDDEVPAVLASARRAGWRWLVPGDDGYPELLQHVADPPLGLFVRGELRPAPVVAVVGSRRATAYGRQVARLLAEELAAAGVIVASGMARGVDAAAHEGALAGGGATWAVWGTGPDTVYPAEHRALASAIAAAGALITEYLPGTPPRRHHFPERNRILAGLASAVVVVEAAARSGALITARLALDEGREVLAVPGSILSEVSVGPNTLLHLGARPMLTPRDVLDAIGHPAAEGRSRPAAAHPLLEHLDAGESVTADELVARSGLGISEVHGALLELELAGDVERARDGRFLRRRVEAAGE